MSIGFDVQAAIGTLAQTAIVYALSAMTMERFRRVAQLWNWLPAFRGVAEHESIHKASAALATSASALSRTVKLLEDSAGFALFTRRGAGMTLTENGARILSATRNAMRLMDDALTECGSKKSQSTYLWVGVVSPTASAMVALALAESSMREMGRSTIVEVDDHALPELLRGDVDLVVTPVAATSADLTVERVGDATIGVYAAPNHPLARAAASSSPGSIDVSTCAFVVREGDDGWPIERPRNVAETSSSLEGVLAYCSARELLTCLPDSVGARLVGGSLVRISTAGTQTLYAVRRRPLHSQHMGEIEVVVSALRKYLLPI